MEEVQDTALAAKPGRKRAGGGGLVFWCCSRVGRCLGGRGVQAAVGGLRNR